MKLLYLAGSVACQSAAIAGMVALWPLMYLSWALEEKADQIRARERCPSPLLEDVE